MTDQKPLPTGFVIDSIEGVDLRKGRETVTLKGTVPPAKRIRVQTVKLHEVKP